MERDEKILMDIYRQMYLETDPPADIDEILRTGEGQQHNWFMKYHLSMDRQLEIIEEVLTKWKVKPKWKRNAFRTTVILGGSPTSKTHTNADN